MLEVIMQKIDLKKDDREFFVSAYNALTNKEKKAFFQFFVIEKMALAKAFEYTIFPEERAALYGWDE